MVLFDPSLVGKHNSMNAKHETFGDPGRWYGVRNSHECVALEKYSKTNWHLLGLESSRHPLLLVVLSKS